MKVPHNELCWMLQMPEQVLRSRNMVFLQLQTASLEEPPKQVDPVERKPQSHLNSNSYYYEVPWRSQFHSISAM